MIKNSAIIIINNKQKDTEMVDGRTVNLLTDRDESQSAVFALRKFRNFAFGTKVTIFTDHNPLMYLKECAPKSSSLTRWSLGLQEFDITWSFKPGSENQAADCLSRLG